MNVSAHGQSRLCVLEPSAKMAVSRQFDRQVSRRGLSSKEMVPDGNSNDLKMGIRRRSSSAQSASTGPSRRNSATRSNSLFLRRKGRSLLWSNLSVTAGQKGGKVILDNVHGATISHEVTVIMGHSGSGKTTLLKALSGRLAFQGTLKLAGISLDASSIKPKRQIAFNSYEDALEPAATTFEAIWFSASLRLPKSLEDKVLSATIGAIIEQLGLTECADTQCRYLSAGQRCRVSIAIELVVRPRVVILDEPTTGLDSFNAVVLLECLQKVAMSGACVVLSIHHPSWQMFESMDRVLLSCVEDEFFFRKIVQRSLRFSIVMVCQCQ